ncbi:MAG: glycosyl transferase [Stackebrandtia sp.]
MTATLEAAPLTVPETRRRRGAALIVPAIYVVASVVLYAGLWADPAGHYLADSGQDQHQWEWFFAVTAKAVTELDNPLFTALQNYPLGVNLMANTTMLAVSAPLTPVTLLFGPEVTWVLVLNASLAANAVAWYWLLHRRLGRSRLAAGVGGAFCAFAPPVITHAHAHPNFTALFVLPFIVAQLIRLWNGDRPVRSGVVLGLLTAYQIFVGEEVLLLFATGAVIFAIAYAASRPRDARAAIRPLGAGLGVGAAVALVLVGFPLYWQFFGPQSYSGLLHGNAGNDLAALTSFAARSLAGSREAAGMLASPTEQNSFFGWPLAVFVVAASAALWRVAAARALSVLILVATLLSLGSYLVVNGRETAIPGPWLLFSGLPLYESVLESRLTMICVPAIGILLALVIDRMRLHVGLPYWQRTPRLLWTGALLAVLLPLAPTPFTVTERDATPEFFTQGMWREYVPEGGTLVTVPVPDAGDATALHWQVRSGLGFAVPEGYFIGPAGPKRDGVYGAVARPTTMLLREARDTGQVPDIADAEQRQACADLRYWGADAVVLGPHPREIALRSTVERLLGPGEWTGGVWVWTVECR